MKPDDADSLEEQYEALLEAGDEALAAGTSWDPASDPAVPPELVKRLRGARGCLVADHTGAVEVPGRPVAVADTVGAGDAFSAAFLAFWLRGASSIDAANKANDLGAFVASCHGAVPAYTDAIRSRLGLASTQRTGTGLS